ncbi:hypothetical protein Pyn_17193 [Prunus yedoensis var. nudiflora]|uniref:Uncharacterized protein n=1 Tax=Prunus yedoensis var. nudiflora TaxID=2094558 RepID=A0A314XLP0_PRUYE|nr:hypothetical protein Pyn_17193 [Prunus yedoensis var. nudiflora]
MRVPKVTQLCRKAMWLGTWVPKATQIACRKAMWLGTWVPKASQSLRVARRCGQARRCRLTQACVPQGNGPGIRMPKATQSLRVARRCVQALGCRRRHKACMSQGDVARHLGAEGTKFA